MDENEKEQDEQWTRKQYEIDQNPNISKKKKEKKEIKHKVVKYEVKHNTNT